MKPTSKQLSEELRRQFLTLLDAMPQADALSIVAEVARRPRPTSQPKPRHGATRPSLDNLSPETQQRIITEFWSN